MAKLLAINTSIASIGSSPLVADAGARAPKIKGARRAVPKLRRLPLIDFIDFTVTVGFQSIYLNFATPIQLEIDLLEFHPECKHIHPINLAGRS